MKKTAEYYFMLVMLGIIIVYFLYALFYPKGSPYEVVWGFMIGLIIAICTSIGLSIITIYRILVTNKQSRTEEKQKEERQ